MSCKHESEVEWLGENLRQQQVIAQALARIRQDLHRDGKQLQNIRQEFQQQVSGSRGKNNTP